MLPVILLACVSIPASGPFNQVHHTETAVDVPSVASTIGKAAIVILVMFSYPLQVHPCRASVDAVLKWRPSRTRPSRESASGSPSRVVLLPLPPSAAGHTTRNDTIGETRFAAITTAIIIL